MAMTKERWEELERDVTLGLTPNEVAEGWHFCHDFDGLLVGPGMFERQFCTCDLPPDLRSKGAD